MRRSVEVDSLLLPHCYLERAWVVGVMAIFGKLGALLLLGCHRREDIVSVTITESACAKDQHQNQDQEYYVRDDLIREEVTHAGLNKNYSAGAMSEMAIFQQLSLTP